VSPTGKLPVLHHGGNRIPDSLAIMEYLEEAFPPPAHPALWPADRAERARARWLAAAMHSGYMKIREVMSFNLCFLDPVPEATPKAHDQSTRIAELEEALREIIKATHSADERSWIARHVNGIAFNALGASSVLSKGED